MASPAGIDERADVATPDAIVLETKVTPPRLRPEHVDRGELLAVLRAAGPRKLTLVAAPPGFGKSTLLASWAAAEDAPAVAWLSLDEHDNDPVRFLTYVAAALRQVEPELGDRALAALRMPGLDLLTVVLPRFLNDLAHLGSDVLLVLEDYHAIQNPAVHAALAYIVERSPDALRLVVSTREDPPLPLARLRARGELVEIRAADLRFSDAETHAFLVDRLGVSISPSDAVRLRERTEGWPAALYLAALSLRGRTDASRLIDRFAGDDRYVVDYLTTEVLARQSPHLRAFLLQTSILGRFCAPLCDAVTGSGGSAALLAELERLNLLLVPLDTTREWYRYHHLFGELLRHELAATQPGSLPELHRRASRWYREAGLIVDAADQAIAAGDVEAVAELVAGHYAVFVDRGQIATVLRWLDALPVAEASRDWLLCFGAGVVTANAGRIEEAERWLERGERAPAGSRAGLEKDGALAALAATLRLIRGDIGGTVLHARRALAAPGPDAGAALGPQMVLASGLWWSGRTAEAKGVLDAARRTADAAGVPVYAVYAAGMRAAIALDEGDDATADALTSAACELIRASGLEEHAWTAMAQMVRGSLLGRGGDLAAASDAIEHGIALGERLHAWQVIAYGAIALAEVRQRGHDSAAARRLLRRARDELRPLPDPGDGLARVERMEKALRLRAGRDRRADPAGWELSTRELEVLRLLQTSLSQREIAAELYVSFNTVRTHTRVIFEKLGVASRAEAVARGRELGLL